MATRRTTPGTRLLSAEIDVKTLDRLAEFSKRRGQSKRFVLEQAINRHIDIPPEIDPSKEKRKGR